MFQDLIDLISGWYLSYARSIRDMLQTSQVIVNMTPDGSGDYVTQTVANDINPEIWSAYVPWEALIAAVLLIVFVVCLFKFMRAILCRIL